MRRAIFVVFAGLLILSFSFAAIGKTERQLGYRYKNVWNAAVRFVRVDLGYKLIEKDKETGYLLFEYNEGGAKGTASMELIPYLKNNRQMVKLRLQISSMPSYVEGMVLDKLLRKLKDEYGAEPVVEQIDPRKLERKSAETDDDEEKEPAERDDEQAEDDSTEDES